MRYIGKHPVISAVVLLALGSAVQAAPITPEVDFRSGAFASANNQSSFRYTNTINDIDYDFTVRAQGGAGRLWWDNNDGLGIRGGEHDEISAGQTLRIDFHNQAPLSQLFFSDLFAGESAGGRRYNERGMVTLNGSDRRSFTAGLAEHRWGDAANGEAILELLDIPKVDYLELTVGDDQSWHEFSLLGLTDPEPEDAEFIQDPGERIAQVPLPGSALLIAAGLVGLLARRP